MQSGNWALEWVKEKLTQWQHGARASPQSAVRLSSLAGVKIGFDVSDPDRLSRQDDKALGSNQWGLILRILIVLFLGVLFWQTALASRSL